MRLEGLVSEEERMDVGVERWSKGSDVVYFDRELGLNFKQNVHVWNAVLHVWAHVFVDLFEVFIFALG